MLSGKRFFTKKRIKFILRRIILPLLLVYIGVGMIVTTLNMNEEEGAQTLILSRIVESGEDWV